MGTSWIHMLERRTAFYCVVRVIEVTLITRAVVQIPRYLPDRLQPVHPSRPICLSGDAKSVSKSFLRVVDIVVRDGRMRRDPVIPQSDRAVLPSHTHLEILTIGDMLKEILILANLGHGEKNHLE